MNIDHGQFSAWIGTRESRTERLAAAPARGLAATLNREDLSLDEGSPLPCGWHWLYFLPLARQSELGEDGHPKLGGFLPPIPLPRRMWAAGNISVSRPLRIGDEVVKTTTIHDISVKEGRSGTLIFVTLLHELSTADGLAISEVQDLVYRAQSEPGQGQPAGKPAPVDEAWSMTIDPDPVLLFRYSALTFNGHRIHYDPDYATGVEHYPGLVVHGPLIATLLVELLERHLPPGEHLRQFAFRAIHPTFAGQRFTVCARPGQRDGEFVLWARNHQGFLTMEATASTKSR